MKGKDLNITQIIQDFANSMSYVELSKKHGITIKDAKSIERKFKHLIVKEKNKNKRRKKFEEKLKSLEKFEVEDKNNMIVNKITIESLEKSDLYESYDSLIVGLCNDRHEMNTDKFIFQTISDDKMFDYEYLCMGAKRFILDEIPFEDDVPTKELCVKTTGLNCLHGAVVRACNELKINLKFLHWNASQEEYLTQVVLNGFETIKKKNPYANIFTKEDDGIVFIEDSIKEKQPSDSFYVFVRRSKGLKESTIIENREIAWNVYIDYAERITLNREFNESCYLDICRVKENDRKELYISSRKNVSKCYNYPRY